MTRRLRTHASGDPRLLQRYAPRDPPPSPGTGVLGAGLFEGQDAQRAFRQRFGRSISMEKIEVALRQAHRGAMLALTDLSRETVDTDPHLASVLNKRLGAVSSLPIEVTPAVGSGANFDKEKAQFYADVVREQIHKLDDFRQTLYQLAWALFDGRAAQEKVWIQLSPGEGPTHAKYGTVQWALGKLAWIHPRRLSFGPERELRVIDEIRNESGNFTTSGIALNDVPFKFVYWTPQLFGEYPEREGLAPRCLYWSFFKRFAARERMVLTELFGKPWRVLEVEEESSASGEDLIDADKIVDQLGSTNSARLPRGTKLNIVQPGRTAGAVHGEVIAESDRQMSKLVLGQTGTTDGVPSGMNNNQANVMQDEQLGILIFDASRLSEILESHLADEIIALNFGWGEVTHAPKISLRSDLPADRKAELERLQLALNAGLPIARDEAYRVSGFRIPNEEDVVVKIDQPPTPPLAPVPPPPRPVIVFPADGSPAVGEQQPPAQEAATEPGGQPPNAQVGSADAAITITVNEDRAARGLEPLLLPDGTPDPDGGLTIEEFKTKKDAALAPEPTPAAPSTTTPNVATAPQLARVMDASDLAPKDGPGGAHVHSLDREALVAVAECPHRHAFLLPDGRLVFTEFDGDHGHVLEAIGADETSNDGEHAHQIVIDGVPYETGADISTHSHSLLVTETGLDGVHPHTLELPDPDGGEPLEIQSLSPGEFAEGLADGTIPAAPDVDGAKHKDKRKMVARLSPAVGNELAVTLVAATYKARDGEAALNALLATSCAHCAFDSIAGEATPADVTCVRDHRQPATDNGSPESILERSQPGTRAVMRRVVEAFMSSVQGLDSAHAIFAATVRAREGLNVQPLARELERRMIQSAALGALDNALEIENDSPAPGDARIEQVVERGDELSGAVTEAQASKVTAANPPPDFSKMRFQQALRVFRSKNIVTRAAFDRMSALARNQAFTVAGVMGDQALTVIHAELAAAIGGGRSLANFSKFIESRMQSAGFLARMVPLPAGGQALSASHVETVFRTNTLNAYNAGRSTHAKQPSVMRARPVWEFRVVNDKGTRANHRALSGRMVLASDPIWTRVYPPFGFNCRCRVVTRGRDQLGRVVPGTTVTGVPDTGFTSGVATLIPA